MSAYAIKNESGLYWTGIRRAAIRAAKEWATLRGASTAAAKALAASNPIHSKLFIVQTV